MINKVILVGRVGKDPVLKSTKNGYDVCAITLATTERWKDSKGDKQEATEWHYVKFYGKSSRIVADCVRKGSMLYVEGKIHTVKSDDKYFTEIVCDRFQFLPDGKTNGKAKVEPKEEPKQVGIESIEDDIPW
jgi:single-strand DNA-binding protein